MSRYGGGHSARPRTIARGMSASDAPVLELKGITKRFPGVVANDGVDFDLRAG